MNRLLDMVDSKVLEIHSDSLGAWLEVSADVVDSLQVRTIPLVK